MTRGALGSLLAALVFGLPLAVRAFDAIYAFGDSLTDTGNNPPTTGDYYAGRYSNGPLWIEYFSTNLDLTYEASNNFAVSGAETSGALSQVRQFAAPADATNALFSVWAGGNDFIDHLGVVFTQGLNDTFWNGIVADGVSNLVAAVNALYADGARAVLVPNLVDLSRLPAAANLPPNVLTYFHGKVVQFNAALAAQLGAVQSAHPDLTLMEPDVYSQFNLLLTNFAAYGFTTATQDALDDPALSDKSFSGPGADYVFWDSIHPTTKTHALLAQWFALLLPPATWPRLNLMVAGTLLQVSFTNLQVGRTYTFQSSTNLVAWTDRMSFTATNATQQTSLDLTGSSRGFFRLTR